MDKLMRVAVVIPARMASSRFPGKPLVPILGLPMIEHVRRRALLCKKVDQVVVATCDEEIRRTVEAGGGLVEMTSPGYRGCIDRVIEAAGRIGANIVVNLQGDEPLVTPEMIEGVVTPLKENPDLACANLMTKIRDDVEFNDPDAVKVVVSVSGDLLYCSREPIPSVCKAPNQDFTRWKQLGIMAFQGEYLQLFGRLKATPLEVIESIDILRAVENGWRIRMIETKDVTFGVDRASDIASAERLLAADPLVDLYLSKSSLLIRDKKN